MSEALSRISQAFSRAAPHYDTYAQQQQQVLETLWLMAQPAFEKANFILDIGCGTGALAVHCPNKTIIGIDAAFGMCQQAARKGILAICGDMHALPTKQASAPAIISSLAMQWSDDLAAVLRSYASALNAGGALAFSIYLSNTLNELNNCFKALGEPSPLRVHVSHEKLLDLIKASGLILGQSQQETLKLQHNNLKSLLLYMKHIGAHTPVKGAARLRGAQQLRLLEKIYQRQHASIVSSWEVGYYLLHKPL